MQCALHENIPEARELNVGMERRSNHVMLHLWDPSIQVMMARSSCSTLGTELVPNHTDYIRENSHLDESGPGALQV